MKIKATAFRQNIYQFLDKILAKGEPLEIERNGRTIIIMEKKKKDIYTVMDERTSVVSEPATSFDAPIKSGLDDDWQKTWENQWKEWLSEK